MWREAGDAKNRTTSLTSAGSISSNGMAFEKMCLECGSPARSVPKLSNPSTMGVLTPLGLTQLTRMFLSANSLAIDLARPMTPCFAAT